MTPSSTAARFTAAGVGACRRVRPASRVRAPRRPLAALDTSRTRRLSHGRRDAGRPVEGRHASGGSNTGRKGRRKGGIDGRSGDHPVRPSPRLAPQRGTRSAHRRLPPVRDVRSASRLRGFGPAEAGLAGEQPPMLHWTPDHPCRTVTPIGALLGRAATPSCHARAAHARMLAHAAARRRAASGTDAEYWKACAPAAVAKAVSLRGAGGFARLP